MKLFILYRDKTREEIDVQYVSNCCTTITNGLLLYVPTGVMNIPENRVSIRMSKISCFVVER